MTPATATPNKRANGHRFTGPATDKHVVQSVIRLSEKDVDRSLDDEGKEKREIVLTCLQEGRGNERDRRYYLAEAVSGVEKLMYAKRKMFVDHLNEDNRANGDPLRNWAGTMKKTWLEESSDGRQVRKVRVKIHEEWLWQRCKDAPEEIALSIEGRGAGRQGEVNGEQYMLIERIYHLDAFKFVTYPGNADMGADLVESAARPEKTKEESMELTELSLTELRKGRPDLVEALVTEAAAKAKADAEKAAEAALTEAKAKAGDVAAIRSTIAGEVKAALDEQAKSLNKTIDALNEKLAASERRVEAAEVREKLAAKRVTIDKLLSESKLPAEARTPRFLERLSAISERSIKVDGKDQVLTVEAQVREEIAEQEKLVGVQTAGKKVEVAAVTEGAAKGDGKAAPEGEADLTEGELGAAFRHSAGLSDESLEQYRERIKKEKAAA